MSLCSPNNVVISPTRQMTSNFNQSPQRNHPPKFPSPNSYHRPTSGNPFPPKDHKIYPQTDHTDERRICKMVSNSGCRRGNNSSATSDDLDSRRQEHHRSVPSTFCGLFIEPRSSTMLGVFITSIPFAGPPNILATVTISPVNSPWTAVLSPFPTGKYISGLIYFRRHGPYSFNSRNPGAFCLLRKSTSPLNSRCIDGPTFSITTSPIPVNHILLPSP
jgi:hypothetical protein